MTYCYWLLLLRQKNNLCDRFDNIVGQAIQRAICPWKSRQIGWGGWLRNSDNGLGVFLKFWVHVKLYGWALGYKRWTSSSSRLKVTNLFIELYVLAVVRLMKCTVANQLMEHLLTDCMNLLKVLYWTWIEYIYIANQCVDELVKLCSSL